jgi:RNA methyltransferase, TrmH family
MMETITSKDNQLIKEIKKLKEKRYRDEKGQFIVEGFRFCSEALMSHFEIPFLFISEGSLDRWKSFNLENKLQNSTKVYQVKDSVLKSICSTDTPQGVAAVASKANTDLRYDDGFYILADRIQDPGNMGTIIRTAHAAGASGVITTEGTVDIYNEKTMRSTMGSIFHIKVIEDSDLKIIKELKNRGFKLVVSTLDTDKNFFDVSLKDNVIIAVGNEGNGISDRVQSIADIKVKIPMPGGAESLNVGVAASIMIFEKVRQDMM